MKLTIDNVDTIQVLCNDLGYKRIDNLEDMWCPNCEEQTTFYYNHIPCKCPKDHSAIACDKCKEIYIAERKDYMLLEIYNRRQFGDERPFARSE